MNTLTMSVILGMIAITMSLADTTDTRKRVEDWLWNPAHCNPSALSPAERDEVIPELRAEAASKSELSHKSTANLLLVRLDDEQTISSLLDTLHIRKDTLEYRDAGAALGRSGQPAVIPRLIPDLQDPSEVHDQTTLVGPMHNTAAFVIFEIIKTSPELGDRVIAPMREKMAGFDGMAGMRASLLAWYEQNKEHFEKRDYAAVTPLQTVTTPGAQPDVQVLASNPAVVPAPAVQATAPSPPPVAAAKPAPLNEPASASPVRILIFAVVVLSGVAAVWLLAKRRHNKE